MDEILKQFQLRNTLVHTNIQLSGSLNLITSDDLIKGKTLPIGTQRQYGGQKYIKTADGWKPVKGDRKQGKVDQLIEESRKLAEREGRTDRYIYIDPVNVGGQAKSKEVLKKEAGEFIYTHLLYGRKSKPISRDVRDAIVSRKEPTIKDKQVSISKINIPQTFVLKNHLNKPNKEKITLYSKDGELYLNDGNHRVASAYLRGEGSIKADIVEVE